jgi:hypothetical protein
MCSLIVESLVMYIVRSDARASDDELCNFCLLCKRIAKSVGFLLMP